MNISNDFLYSTFKITSIFYNKNGDRKQATGTGFGLTVNDIYLLVTCRHVVDPAFDPDDGANYYGFSLTELEIRGKNRDASGQPTVDGVAVFDALKAYWPADNVTDVAVLAQLRTKDRQNVRLSPMDSSIMPTAAQLADLSIGDPVTATGYVDLHDTVDLRPLLRSGNISSDPRYPFSIPMNNGPRQNRGPIVAYDCFSWGGLSGGPVVAVQIGSTLVPDRMNRKAFLTGVNAGHLKNSSRQHSGLSYFYRIEAVLSLINDVYKVSQLAIPFPWVTASVPSHELLVGWDE